MPQDLTAVNQCSKLLPVRQPEADNFGGGPGTFIKLFFNFMFMIWDSKQQDWQLFWLSFEHCVNIGFGNGLVPSGNKPLSEPMLSKFLDPK